jgi:hypothetical protein
MAIGKGFESFDKFCQDMEHSPGIPDRNLIDNVFFVWHGPSFYPCPEPCCSGQARVKRSSRFVTASYFY